MKGSKLTKKDKADLAEYAQHYDRPEYGRHRAPAYRGKVWLATIFILLAANVVDSPADSSSTTTDAAAVVAPAVEAAPLDLSTERDLRLDRADRRVLKRAELARRAVRVAPPPIAKKPAVSRAEIVVKHALSQVGKPYRWAQDGPSGYDCSGLVLASFARIGIKLPHYSYSQARYGRAVSRAQLARGDLVVMNNGGHVGIYLGSGKIVHASSTKGRVVIGSIWNYYAARRL